MTFDATTPAINQTYGDAIASTRANLNDLQSQVTTHEADQTAHGITPIADRAADYANNHKNSTTAHGLPAVNASLAAVVGEVTTGRGSAASLSARLGVALNGDGTLKLSGLADKWLNDGDTPAYVSATAFTVPGNRMGFYLPGLVLRFTLASGYVYAPVISRSFASGATTVTLDTPYAVLDGTLSAVEVAVIGFDAAITASLAAVQESLTTLQSAVTTVLGFATTAAEPPTGIPAGKWALVKNTTTGALKLWANDSGTLRSITLS